jgi:hypothetical protein
MEEIKNKNLNTFTLLTQLKYKNKKINLKLQPYPFSLYLPTNKLPSFSQRWMLPWNNRIPL